MAKEEVNVKISLFRKPSYLKEKCDCSKEATIRVVASYNKDHCYVHCCTDPICIQNASSQAAMKLFKGPRSLALGPEILKESGAEAIDTFNINYKK